MIVQNLIAELNKENLFYDISPPGDYLSMSIYGQIQTDTRKVKAGDVFACIKGHNVDGHDLALNASEKGAILLIVEHRLRLPVPQIRVSDCRKATAILARLFYNDPTAKFDLIGVTGTNGKTTTTHILQKLFTSQNIKTGLIGTLGYKIGDEMHPLMHTTPDIIELNSIFAQMVEAACQVVVMEVSSHALALHRVYGLHFKQAVFTNLTQDHLDFHETMTDYFNAKMTLFRMVEAENGTSIINGDDEYGRKILLSINNKSLLYYIGDANNCSPSVGDDEDGRKCSDGINAVPTSLSQNGTTFDLSVNKIQYKNLHLPLPGKFNLYNLLAALACLRQYTIDAQFQNLLTHIQELTPVPGRLQTVPNDAGITIIIDYAHTPDALQNILQTVNEFKTGRVIAVWGCGGNRDADKRPKMATISTTLADLTIITTDNPRHEHPADIIRDITRPLAKDDPYFIISDRATAIYSAILLAQPGDTVIVAGKGHEKYQEIGDTRYFFDDTETATKALFRKELYTPTENQLAIPFDILNLEKIINIQLQNHLLQHYIPLFTAISTDSRNIVKNTLFIAIKGEHFDGADYAPDVLLTDPLNWCLVNIVGTPFMVSESESESNGTLFNTSETPSLQQPQIIYTKDTTEIYGDIAKKYLQLFPATKIAITGSTGKTTTKEILYNILSVSKQTLKTHDNENNKIGVPKTIFNIQPTHKYAILEIGTNQIGEIDYLSNIVKPDYALIVSINPSHLEGLGTLENIAKEKMSLLPHTQKLAIIARRDAIYCVRENMPTVLYVQNPLDENQYLQTSTGLTITINDKQYPTVIGIPFLANNIAFAITLAQKLGISDEDIIAGLAKKLIISGRMEIINKNNHTIIYDYYNANPTSLSSAINYWATLKPDEPHLAILGEMRELGEQEIQFHQQIGDLTKLLKKTNHTIIGVGHLTKYYNPDTLFNTVDDLINSGILAKYIGSDGNHLETIILVKGSHSLRLELLKGVL